MIRNSVRVKRLGLVPYSEAFKVQQQHVEAVLNERPRQQTLLMLEHPPVYTVGLRSQGYGQEEADRLRALGADFVRTNRGGLITFHGPGQLVVYPILDLNSFKARDTSAGDKNLSVGGVKWYVAQLEAALIEACFEAGLKDARAPGHPLTGVWNGSGRKVASIGVHNRDGVTSHGAALNCDVDLAWFRHVSPCGMDGASVTSLSQELKRQVTVDEMGRLFENAFAECLQCDLTVEK